jgi:hypothetical protein
LIDDSIRNLLQQIYQNYTCSGIVILIDDIYKIKDYTHVALKFLNHLQTFKGELTKETGITNIGFFISAPLDWNRILNDDLSYSGSVTREETMPMITMDDALNMLNNRLEAFAINKENSKKLRSEFVQQIYRQLISKTALTFRQFIKESIRQFENGNFDILKSNPVAIGSDTLKKIRTLFEDDAVICSGIERIMKSPMSAKNKIHCFQLLIQIYIERGVRENSETFKDRYFYFNELKRSSLIVKTQNKNYETIWKISPDLARLNEKINSQYSYSLEDYFFKIYKNSAIVEDAVKDVGIREEIIKCEALNERVKNRKSGEFATIRLLLDEAIKLHKEIIKQLYAPSIKLNQKKLEKDCDQSIELISRAIAVFSGYKGVIGLDFWNDFWRYPDSVSEYIKRSSTKDATSNTRVWYIGSAYEAAFSDIVEFLDDQIKKSEIFSIPLQNLKPDEIREFDTAREEYSNREYDIAVSIVSELVESKIREFLHNIFVLQYGEEHKRIQRLPSNLRQYISKNIQADEKTGLAISKNEFLYLNRHDYSYVIRGPHSPGDKNWVHTFSKIFSDWNEDKIFEFLQQFARLNLTSSHHKRDSLTHEQQTMIYSYIISSIDFVRKINQSYTSFLKGIQKVETTGSIRNEYFFSLDQCKDIQELSPINISKEEAGRIIEMWRRSKENYFDLSNQQQLEQKHGMPYRQLYAILAVLLKGPQIKGVGDIKITKENSPMITVEIIKSA